MAGLSNRACSVGFASCETLGKHYHASLRLRSFGSARPCADSVRPLSCILARRACSVGFASVPRQPFGLPHLCIDSHLCRCIVQRLCVAVFMHPCITALCGCLYASMLKTLGVHFIRHPCLCGRLGRCIVQRLCATAIVHPCTTRTVRVRPPAPKKQGYACLW